MLKVCRTYDAEGEYERAKWTDRSAEPILQILQLTINIKNMDYRTWCLNCFFVDLQIQLRTAGGTQQ